MIIRTSDGDVSVDAPAAGPMCEFPTLDPDNIQPVTGHMPGCGLMSPETNPLMRPAESLSDDRFPAARQGSMSPAVNPLFPGSTAPGATTQAPEKPLVIEGGLRPGQSHEILPGVTISRLADGRYALNDHGSYVAGVDLADIDIDDLPGSVRRAMEDADAKMLAG